MKKSFLFSLLIFSFTAYSQVPVFNSGIDSNKIIIVFLSEGYTSPEMDKYRANVDTVVNGFFKFKPFKTYKNYFKIYRIDIASQESGIDDLKTGVYKNTAFDGSVNASHEGLFSSFSKIQDTLTKYLPQWQYCITVFNTDINAGAASPSDHEADIGASFNMVNTAVHEFGHIFSNLSDEYIISGSPAPTSAPEPNVAIAPDTARSGTHAVKWWKWLTPGVEMPTDFYNPGNYDVVGLFSGAKYSAQAYRPEMFCMMLNAQGPYCRICTEAIVLKIHEKVNTIENSNPAKGTAFYNFYDTYYSVSMLDTANIKYETK